MQSRRIIFHIALAAAAFAFLFGCGSVPSPRNSSSQDIAQIHIITTPLGLNFDQVPGPDGFSLKLYASTAENPKAVPIRSGDIKIFMFDGTLFGKTNLPPPLRQWTFSAEELRQYQFKASIGAGYEISLLWGTNRPSERLVTVAARYTAPSGSSINSEPSSVTVTSY